MGCCASKNKLNKHKQLARSESRLTVLSDLYKLKRTPQPLEAETEADGFISCRLFHNLYYNGFYAPYICNPNYLLILDCRGERDYNRQHVMMSRWRGQQDLEVDLSHFTTIVLYDDQSTGWEDASSELRATYDSLRGHKLTPVCVSGGFRQMETKFPYMWSSKILTINTFKNKYLQWYPSLVTDELVLGRADQAANPNVVYDMGVSHIVSLLNGQTKVFNHVTYLLVPLEDSEEQELLAVLPRIFKFVTEALESGGRVLIHCDQGVNRAAAVTMAYLMAARGCTLEDAYFYLESLRPTIQPAYHFLKQLMNYEAEIFGRKLSNIDDLEF